MAQLRIQCSVTTYTSAICEAELSGLEESSHSVMDEDGSRSDQRPSRNRRATSKSLGDNDGDAGDIKSSASDVEAMRADGSATNGVDGEKADVDLAKSVRCNPQPAQSSGDKRKVYFEMLNFNGIPYRRGECVYLRSGAVEPLIARLDQLVCLQLLFFLSF
jgi:hypothetical protein